MLKTEIKALKKEIQKIHNKEDRKVYIAFIDENKNITVNQGSKTVFEGIYEGEEYERWKKKRLGNDSTLIVDDILISLIGAEESWAH